MDLTHARMAVELMKLHHDQDRRPEARTLRAAEAQVHATLAQVEVLERVASALERLDAVVRG